MQKPQIQNTKHLILLCTQITALLDHGFDLKTTLEMLIKDETQLRYKKQLQIMLSELNNGSSSTQALRWLLPTNFPLQLDDAPTIPNLTLFLTQLKDYYEEKQQLHQKLMKLLYYPIILKDY